MARVRSWVARVALIAAVVAIGPRAHARPDSGPGILLGTGSQTGGYGLSLAYYRRLGDGPWHLVPHAGGGYVGSDRSFVPDRDARVGWCGGMLLVRGIRHRAVLAIDFGTIGHERVVLHRTQLGWKAAIGPQLGVGYELSRNAFLFRVVPGIGYPLGGLTPPSERTVRLVVSLLAGWKLW